MSKAQPKEKLPLDPDCRVREDANGVSVILGDGLPWLLHDGGLCNLLDPVRDRLFDDSTLAGQVKMDDVFHAAHALLVVNYDLDIAELGTLIYRADPQALTDAVFEALFGPKEGQRTYTAWAASALLANGLDPASIPVAMMPHVLHQLVMTKRCVPADQYVDSAEAAPRLAAARARAAATAARMAQPNGTTPEGPTPEPGPEEDPKPEESE